MRKLFFILLLPSCTTLVKKEPENKKYTVVMTVKEKDLISNNYFTNEKIDTILAATDSAAYFEGVFTYLANVVTNKKLAKMNVTSYSIAKDFEVRDENGMNVRNNLSEACLTKAKEFMEQKIKEEQ